MSDAVRLAAIIRLKICMVYMLNEPKQRLHASYMHQVHVLVCGLVILCMKFEFEEGRAARNACKDFLERMFTYIPYR